MRERAALSRARGQFEIRHGPHTPPRVLHFSTPLQSQTCSSLPQVSPLGGGGGGATYPHAAVLILVPVQPG